MGVRLKASAYRITFDVHRAAGLWTWFLLGVLAFTSIHLNLGDEITKPVTGIFSTLTPGPYDRVPAPAAHRDISHSTKFCELPRRSVQ
jgi:uncharacterized iron-regulated membrane protein